MHILSPFLAIFIHHVFVTSIFSNNLKIVKVLLVFKVSTKLDVNNYYPILIFPYIKASSKIDL